MENYLLYGETLEQGVERILLKTLPTAPLQNLHFSFMYHFENEATNRLIYLFITLTWMMIPSYATKSLRAESFGHSSK